MNLPNPKKALCFEAQGCKQSAANRCRVILNQAIVVKFAANRVMLTQVIEANRKAFSTGTCAGCEIPQALVICSNVINLSNQRFCGYPFIIGCKTKRVVRQGRN